MNQLLNIGTTIVVFALISYSIAFFYEQRKKILRRRILVFLTLGVVFDITAKTLMLLGSEKEAFLWLGVTGILALTVMLIDAIIIWRLKMKNGAYCHIPGSIRRYSRYAFTLWVVAFIAGEILITLV